jgi:threonine dehydrogenase-like Zn-dependent dehydrogenase
VAIPETGSLAGQLVLVDPLLACGACVACARGAPNACAQLRLLGIDRHGALAGKLSVAGDRLHPVPEGLPASVASLAEPLAVAVHAVGRAPKREDGLAVVIGGGPVGLCVAHVARRAGLRVFLAEPAATRRQLAAALAFELLGASDPIADLEERTSGRLADLVFDAAAAPTVAAMLHRFVAPTGWIGIVGAYGAPPQMDLLAVMFKELTIVGHRTYGPADLQAALAMLADDADALAALVTKVVKPDAVPDVLHAMRRGEGMKYVVECPA